MDVSPYTSDVLLVKEKTKKVDYGDWQTSYEFAKSVCLYLKGEGIAPEVIIEPTCGVGNFIAAAIDVFDTVRAVYGIEIFKSYVSQTEQKLRKYAEARRIEKFSLYNANVFAFDFTEIVNENQNRNILVLGNPPWVTNSGLGKNESTNLPFKGNIDKVRGIDAITGKGNFDIAESICNRVIDAFSSHKNTHIALLVKNSVIRNILYRQNKCPRNITDIKQLGFDAKREFNVSVAASLFECHLGRSCHKQCTSYDFYDLQRLNTFGWVNDAFVSNVEIYGKSSLFDGRSPLVWRSGIKHDCSKIMELSVRENVYTNGLNEIADVDTDTLFPLLKSSDIGKGVKGIRKYLVLPQASLSEDTLALQVKAPKTYSYLMSHAQYLDERKSAIYRNKPRFSVFGLGEYSFAPYKVVISALYSDMVFSLIGPIDGKPVMVDDTCYLLGFKNRDYAVLTLHILRSDAIRDFIHSICFMDAKRIVSRELLMRIDLYRLSKTMDLSVTGISKETITKYRDWLYMQTEPGLFN